jgi:uncharacterized phiE125 gp8 family phage protein
MTAWDPPGPSARALPRYRLTRRGATPGLAVSLADAVLHLRLAPGSESGPEAPLIERLIRTATATLENYADLSVLEQDWTMRLAALPNAGASIVIPRPPLIAIDNLNVAGDPLDADDYHVELDDRMAGVLWPANGWWPVHTVGPGAVAINFQAGWPVDDIPAPITQAILLAVATWYENRESLSQWTLYPMIEIGWEGLLTPYRSQGFA